MYILTHVYIRNRFSMTAYATSDITFSEVKEMCDLNTTIYAAVQKDIPGEDTKVMYGISLSRLIVDTDIFLSVSWSEVNAKLTDKLIQGYETKIPGYSPGKTRPNNSLVICDPSKYGHFTPHYVDIDTPDYRDAFHHRWKLHDLVITEDKKIDDVTLMNCLVSVNGITHRPIRNNNELYIPNGSKLAWNTDQTHTAELCFLDFTHLGGYEIVDLKDIKIIYRNRSNTFSSSCDWEIVLPEKYSLTDYTPLMLVGGSVVFPDELPKVSRRSFLFSPSTSSWENTYLYRQTRYYQDINRTGIIYETEQSPIDYLRGIQEQGRKSDACIILIKNSQIYVNRISFDVWMNSSVLSITTTPGILYHEATGTVRNYVLTKMSDRYELTFQNIDRLIKMDLKQSDKELAVAGQIKKRQSLIDLQNSNCQMITLTGE